MADENFDEGLPEEDGGDCGEDEGLMFNDRERKYIARVLKKSALNRDQKIDVIGRLHRDWLNTESIFNGQGLDAFIWLPVLAQLYIDSYNKYTIYYYNNFNDTQKLFCNNLANPLEKHLLAYCKQYYDYYLGYISNFFIDKKIKYTSDAFYNTINNASVNFDFFSYSREDIVKEINTFYASAYKLMHERMELKKKLIEERELRRVRLKEEEEARARAQAKARREEKERREREAAKASADKHLDKIREYTEGDTRRNGWPPLDQDILFDTLRGHWDLWGREEEIDGKRLVGRDPARDIEANAVVCIDFGTSSTVVARRLDGKNSLVRVGVSDWSAAPRAADFENPTSLEFIDMEAVRQAWEGEYFRPRLSWSHLKCAHQARGDVAPQASQAQINSIIQDLKSWAAAGRTVDMVDQRGLPFRLSPDSDKNEGALNPISLYAWHLGLALNNQYHNKGRIYRRYYLSFPASFDRTLRRHILDAFAQGLERSLPASLGSQEILKEENFFEVKAGVDEPVAYAACALEGIEPGKDEKIAFGVFDFGGGTTDFAFGQYRLANAKEEEQGFDYMLELMDVAGLPDLGGEKLLHSLAHNIISLNLGEIAARRIPFTAAPLERQPAGSEHVFTDGMIARSNTMRLVEMLRPFWEEGPGALDAQGEGIIRLALQGAEAAEPVMIDLKIDKDGLQNLLRERIGEGVAAFFTAFRQAFTHYDLKPGSLHILPAGNSCRSPLVKELFEREMEAFSQENNFEAAIFQIHELLLPDESDPEAPTLKTGVALGQLKAVPGMGLGIIRRAPQAGEALRVTFGKFKRDKLQPLLTRFSTKGEWVAFGPVRDDLYLRAGWSESPEAMERDMASNDYACHELPIRFEEKDRGRQIFARPVASASVEIAVGDSADRIDENSIREFRLGSGEGLNI